MASVHPATLYAHEQQVKVLTLEQIKKMMLPDAAHIEKVERIFTPRELKKLQGKGVQWDAKRTVTAWIGENKAGERMGGFILVKEKTDHGAIGLAVGFDLHTTITAIQLFEYPGDEKDKLERLIKKKGMFKKYTGKRIVSSLQEGSGTAHMANIIKRGIVRSSLLFTLVVTGMSR